MLTSEIVSSNPVHQKMRLTGSGVRGLATKGPKLIATKHDAKLSRLPPSGMISNMIQMNSMTNKKNAEQKKVMERIEKMKPKTPKPFALNPCMLSTTLAPIAEPYGKTGMRGNTLFTTHNWGNTK